MTTHPSPPQAHGPALPTVPVAPTPGPTAVWLMERRDHVARFLLSRGFSEYVAERAIDRVTQAALPYMNGKPLQNREAWLFGSAIKAARQEAMRQVVRTFMDHVTLASAAATEADGDLEHAIRAALDQLSEPQREAVYCCDMLGLTLREAAVRLKCLRTTVLRNRSRGRVRLRVLLAAYK